MLQIDRFYKIIYPDQERLKLLLGGTLMKAAPLLIYPIRANMLCRHLFKFKSYSSMMAAVRLYAGCGTL